jgi:hypothetical protein
MQVGFLAQLNQCGLIYLGRVYSQFQGFRARNLLDRIFGTNVRAVRTRYTFLGVNLGFFIDHDDCFSWAYVFTRSAAYAFFLVDLSQEFNFNHVYFSS